MMKYSLMLLLACCWLYGCGSYKRVKPKIKERDLPSACEGISQVIKENWKKHRKQDYYYKDREFLYSFVVEYKECFVGMPVEQAIKLLGNTPVDIWENSLRGWHENYKVLKWGIDYYLYYLDDGCFKTPPSCEILQFKIDNGIITNVILSSYG